MENSSFSISDNETYEAEIRREDILRGFDIVAGIIAAIGIIINCSAIFMFFTKKALQNFFNFLLINLPIFDNFYLLWQLLWSTPGNYLGQQTVFASYFFAKFLYPAACIAITGSI